MVMRPRRPRAVVLCPTRELCEQVNNDTFFRSLKKEIVIFVSLVNIIFFIIICNESAAGQRSWIWHFNSFEGWILQVFGVAKSISHHARFRSTMVSGGGRIRPQEDALNSPIDMVVGTPGRILQHIEEGNLVYGDIKYLVTVYFLCICK